MPVSRVTFADVGRLDKDVGRGGVRDGEEGCFAIPELPVIVR